MRAQDKSLHPIVSIVLASAALTATGPAWAHPADPEIVYEEEAVVQPLPGTEPVETGLVAEEPLAEEQLTGQEFDPQTGRAPYLSEQAPERRSSRSLEPIDQMEARPPLYQSEIYQSETVYPPHAMGAPVYFPQAGYSGGAMPLPGEYQHGNPGRAQWLDECRARYDARDGRGQRRGQTIGALLGAATGGLIGNRVAGRGDRVVGTAIGAGVGGLAGAAAGSAVGASSDRREALDECEAFLLQHEAQWQTRDYGYGPVMLVPILVPVEQRPVVREYVTEEWVDEEITAGASRTIPRRAVPAPEPEKTIPAKTKTLKVTRDR